MVVMSQDRSILADASGKMFTCENSRYIKEEYAIYMSTEYGNEKMAAYNTHEDCLIILTLLKYAIKKDEIFFDFPRVDELETSKKCVMENYKSFEEMFIYSLMEVWKDLDAKIKEDTDNA